MKNKIIAELAQGFEGDLIKKSDTSSILDFLEPVNPIVTKFFFLAD